MRPTQGQTTIEGPAELRANTPPRSTGALRRSLGLGSLTFYGVGVILGAGIYSILGEAAGIAGEALWWSFLVASLAALLTGLSYAELATMFPQAGAEYVYVQAAWPKATWLPATLGWVLVATGIATTATVSLAFAGYAGLFVPFPPWAVAAVLVATVATLNVIGVTEASWANIIFTLIEAAGLVALIVVGTRDSDFGRVFATMPHPGVLSGAALIFFSYLGFEEIANLAEEARQPARDLPRAILIAVAVSTVLYILVAVASVALLAPSRLAASPSPLADTIGISAPWLAGALGGVALFATANTALIAMMARAASSLPWPAAAMPHSFWHGRLPGARHRRRPSSSSRRVHSSACPLVRRDGRERGVLAGTRHLRDRESGIGALAVHASGPGAAVSGPLRLGRVPMLTVLGLLVVVLVLTRFEPRAYGIAAVMLAGAFVVQAIPWNRALVSGESPS